MTKKIKNNWLFTIFLIATSLVFLAAFGCTLIKLNNTKPFTYIAFSFMIISIIFIGIGYILKKIKLSKVKELIIIIILFIIGLTLRIYSINYFDTSQTSDFAKGIDLYQYKLEGNKFIYHENKLKDNHYQIYFAQYPSWFTYDFINYKILDIFGSHPSYFKVCNLILFSLTFIFLYIGIKRMFNNKIGLLTLLIFSTMPSLIAYTNVSTPDHFTIFLVSLVIFIWSFVLKNKNIRQKYILTIPLVISMCLINLFKPIAIYMLLVFIASEILVEFMDNLKNLKTYFKNSWRYISYFILIFIGIYLTTNYVLNKSIQNYIKTETVNSSSSYLIWGYSVNDKGDYDPEYIYSDIYSKLYDKYSGNLKLVFEDLDKIAKKTIKSNVRYLPKIWYQKFRIALDDDAAFFNWANTSNNPQKVLNNLNDYDDYLLIANTFMAFIYFMISILCIIFIFKSEHKKELSIILLMLVGYIAILVLGGVQPRYKAIIFPQLSIACAIGIYCIVDLIKLIFAKKKEK